jgi:hypothetical protein
MTPTETLLEELESIQAHRKQLKSTLDAKRQRWVDDINKRTGLDKGAIDAGIWGSILPYTALNCTEKFSEDAELIKIFERIAEIKDRLKWQPLIDAVAQINARVGVLEDKTP